MMDRRDFIKLTAITGTSATLASCGNPEDRLIRFVPDDDVVPGVAEWKPSVCPMCDAGCAVTVRVMDADVETTRNGQHGVVTMAVAKTLEGQPAHSISRGGLCARGQASIQVTYHPDRLRQPMKRTGTRGSAAFEPIAWEAAIAELVSQLDALSGGDPQSLVVMTRHRRGPRADLFAAFAKAFGAGLPVVLDPFGDDVLRRANALSFGREQLPTFDLGRSKYVVGFGADFLATWNSPVAQNAAYGEMRQGHAGVRGKFVQIEPRMSVTGASADEWVPARPGTEGVVALGLAHVILQRKQAGNGGARAVQTSGSAAALIDGWSGGLAEYAPARVEQITGVPAARVERLGRELADSTPAVAIAGGVALAQTNGLFTALAVNALNALLGAVEQPGGVYFSQPVGQSSAARQSAERPQGIVSALGRAKVMLLDDANPVFALPSALHVRDAIERVPFLVSFGRFVDDTSAFADLLLPDHSFLESWVASVPESGAVEAAATSAAPAMKPIHQTRATVDVLVDVASKLKTPIALPWKNGEELVKAAAGDGLQAVWTSTDAQRRNGQSRDGSKTVPYEYAAPGFDGDPQTFPFHFLPYASVAFGDGSSAHLPWLQELPDPMTSAMWSSWVELNPQAAAKMGIADGDVVEVSSAHGSLRAPAVLYPGIAPDAIAMPIGQGHVEFTRYASKRGANPIAILAPATEPETGALAWAATRVRIARVGDRDGSLILFAGEMRERPHELQR